MRFISGKQLNYVIQSLPEKKLRDWRDRMLKIRMQGTMQDLKWFRKLLEHNEAVQVNRVSEAFANKGTKRFFRMYAEVEKVNK